MSRLNGMMNKTNKKRKVFGFQVNKVLSVRITTKLYIIQLTPKSAIHGVASMVADRVVSNKKDVLLHVVYCLICSLTQFFLCHR